jgi:ATP-dependent DNA ligase
LGRSAYVDSVELGIDDATALELRRVLDPMVQPRSPLSAPVKGVKPRWVQPELVVEVAFPNVGEEGRLRHPKFKGVRKDV